MISSLTYRSLFLSQARTATSSSATQDDGTAGRKGGHFIIDVTAIGAAPSVTFTIEAFDPLSNKFYALLVSAAIVAVGTTVLKIYPAITPQANAAASDVLPPTWRVRATHGNTDSITYTVSARLMD